MLDQLTVRRYGCFLQGCKLTTAISVLGWLGVFSSFITIDCFGFLATYLTYQWMFEKHSQIIFSITVLIATFGIICFITNLYILKKNRERSFSGVFRMIKITCTVFAAVEVAGSLILMLFVLTVGIVLYADNRNMWYNGYEYDKIVLCLCVCLILAGFCFIFASLVIHGIRKNIKELVKAYIIFIISVMVIILPLLILTQFTIVVLGGINHFEKEMVVMVVMVNLQIIIAFCIHLGFFIIFYNMSTKETTVEQTKTSYMHNSVKMKDWYSSVYCHEDRVPVNNSKV